MTISIDNGSEPSDAIKKLALVQCEGFRCLAYRDANNRWRDLSTGKELPNVKQVVHTFTGLSNSK